MLMGEFAYLNLFCDVKRTHLILKILVTRGKQLLLGSISLKTKNFKIYLWRKHLVLVMPKINFKDVRIRQFSRRVSD